MCDDYVNNVDSNQPISLKVPGNDRKSRGDLGRNYFNVLMPANCGEEEKQKTEKYKQALLKVPTVVKRRNRKWKSKQALLKGRPVESPMQ